MLTRDEIPRERRIYCNRTLNLRSIRAIGYDMDYTLVHYRIDRWERLAYERLREKLAAQGWPVGSLEFDPDWVIRGLVLDLELGNLVKADRFGYVKRAAHGTRFLDFDTQRETYARTLVDLGAERFVFLNTLFDLSEACMYSQLVELLDEGRIPGVRGYAELYRIVRRSLGEAHVEGELKSEIVRDPASFVEPDPDVALALLDQKHAGKKLVLITNSEWWYTRAILGFALDPFLPRGRTWRQVFDLVLVSARKPHFFSEALPFFEVTDDEGLLRLGVGGLREGGTYVGGSAGLVEECLGLSGAEILYVGDHLYVDVRVTNQIRRWRTALVVRELEGELAALDAFRGDEGRLRELMKEKETLEFRASRLRLDIQRAGGAYVQTPSPPKAALEVEFQRVKSRLASLDLATKPLARRASEIANRRWGLLMRAGSDKSHFARQVERYADIYLSRVSNFLAETPFVYLRSSPGQLPHDLPGLAVPPESDPA